MELKGYTAFNFDARKPYVSVTPVGVTFNRDCTILLGCTEYAQLLINHASGMIALAACSKDDMCARKYYRGRGHNVLSVRWANKTLLNTIAQMAGFDLNGNAYRCYGTYEQNVIFFDLNKARKL